MTDIQSPKRLMNRFSVHEWTGAIGDLGTLLPLAFAIVITTGMSANTLFLLWGVGYVVTGVIFKIPLSVQPLKAMSVIAIAQGLDPELLTSTAFFYGILFLVISSTGIIDWLQKWFSTALVTGIQLGIGLVLAKKAIALVLDHGLFLSQENQNLWLTMMAFLVVLIVLFLTLNKQKYSLGVAFTMLTSILLIILWTPSPPEITEGGVQLELHMPKWSFLLNALTLLIIPQLPLTLGNSVYAASETCHQLWGEQARRVTPRRLGLSVGLSNTLIGLLGGFPMCHGAGGMAGHYQFGGRTGGTTIIIGVVFIVLALLSGISSVLFLVPVPILAAFLLVDGWRMVILIRRLNLRSEYITAVMVGGLTLFTGNLSVALVAGLLHEYLAKHNYYFISEEQIEE